ncbi:MAG: hypothetical protein KME15_06370 [Drouetiella hepatica Uher 2000/2452]|jgi:hypothetical protein|uniref:Yip1 domain-containing protein n=1 Tax=Drouetiella hepatica Uher 2000/2452 TaxID=904376 RepID=A0A951ULH3_9CYAN|nr:hypothetical protein [Drouetiella hepatica Uher 2000/2452]
MAETAIAHLESLIFGALSLKSEAFQQIQVLSKGSQAALLVAFIAGFSQAIGQGIVLFSNQVRPLRFFLSLLMSALLFAFSYVFWALSTWAASILLFRGGWMTLPAVIRTLGLSYAPLIFSFLVALPYLGLPISTVLSIWSFLAFLTGLKAALGLNLWQAFGCGVLGWAVFEGLQRTIGRPLAGLGRWLTNTAAGVNLVTNLKDLERVVSRKTAPVGKEKLK